MGAHTGFGEVDRNDGYGRIGIYPAPPVGKLESHVDSQGNLFYPGFAG